jgi:hypothetical protein
MTDMKTEYIVTRHMDHGIGVLCGMLSRADLSPVDVEAIELAIEHIRAAARLVERFQRALHR